MSALRVPASLAGLLWRDILAQKGLHVSRREFVRWNAVPVVVTMVVGCLVVAGEVCVMYKS
jgi:Na+/H+ antiporter NhaD/arsenite permease-like protein